MVERASFTLQECLLDASRLIRTFVVENFLFGSEDGALEDGASFLESGIIDSTGILELVSFVEENFDIRVHDEELVPDNFDSIDKLAAYLERKRLAAAGPETHAPAGIP